MSISTSEATPANAPELDAILAAMRAGETDGADELHALLSRDPDDLTVIGPLAWAVAYRGEHEEAIALYERYLRLQPANIEVRWRIGDRLINLGRLDEAEAVYRAVLQDHADCEDALMGVRYVQYLRRKETKPGKEAPYIPSKPALTEFQRTNAEVNKREYKEQKLRLESLPTDLFIESTTKCNFYCKTCSKGYDKYFAEDLHEDIRQRVQRELMPANTRVSITGFGEPTLAADFDTILAMTIENGSLVHFVTNASLLNFERLEKLTRCPVYITISFDGATKETFEEIRAGSNFERTLEKLAMIRKLRDIHLSTAYSQFVFNFVALRKNIHELVDVVRIAHRYGISTIGVADYSYNYNEFDEQSLRYDPVRANCCIREAQAAATELGITLIVPPEYNENASHVPARLGFWSRLRGTERIFPEPNRFPRKCSSPWKEPYVASNGTVTPCCTSGQNLGNLKEQSFAQIWNGWRYRFLRWRIHSTLPPIPCRRCFVIWGINGGNAGNVMAKEGLAVKGFYWLEIHARGWARKCVNAGRKLKSRVPGRALPPPAEPNYFRGRPIRDSK